MGQTGLQNEWTILSLIRWSEEYLAEKGVESPRLNAECILASVLRCERVYLYTHFDQPLLREELDRFKWLFLRRANREPLQYILGYADFYGRRYGVKSGVLIPRPETEHLVEAVLEIADSAFTDQPAILDVGTGSGCIAVTLAAELPNAAVTAVDISDNALAVARENARLHNIENQIEFIAVNILENGTIFPGNVKFNIIATNPPYIPIDDWMELPDEIRKHEPKNALTDGGDGLTYYRKLISLAPELLKSGGWLVCEVGHNQSEEVSRLMTGGGAVDARVWRDLQGFNRIIGGQW